MDKKQQLNQLKKDLESRRDIPLLSSSNDVVFGDGNPDAEVMLIGEAAGYYESVEKRPFVGRSGQLLTNTLKEKVGLERKEVYISNIVKARPPENRDPTPEEIEAFRPYLDKEIDIIKPKFIITLGRFSMRKFFGETAAIGQLHGTPRIIDWNGYSITVFPMYHPAAALRATSMLHTFEQDFMKLKGLLSPAPKSETDPEATQANSSSKKQGEQLQLV